MESSFSLISRRLCSHRHIRWRDLLPGRLLRIKLAYKTKSVDVTGCYQWAADTRTETKKARQCFLEQLSDLLDTLAHRNLVLLGDFNTSLVAQYAHVGSGRYQWNHRSCTCAKHHDSGSLCDLIRHHHLCVPNTFGVSGSPYQLHEVSSRIDYIITRLATADGSAKATHHITDAPIRTNCNAGHIPIMTSTTPPASPSSGYHPPAPAVPRSLDHGC